MVLGQYPLAVSISTACRWHSMCDTCGQATHGDQCKGTVYSYQYMPSAPEEEPPPAPTASTAEEQCLPDVETTWTSWRGEYLELRNAARAAVQAEKAQAEQLCEAPAASGGETLRESPAASGDSAAVCLPTDLEAMLGPDWLNPPPPPFHWSRLPLVVPCGLGVRCPR
mgnify:CR=1 FL=1